MCVAVEVKTRMFLALHCTLKLEFISYRGIERLPAQSKLWLFGASISMTLRGNLRMRWLLLIVKWMHPRILEGSLNEELSR